MKYKVIIADTAENLEKKVNEELSHGWELQGGVSTSIIENTLPKNIKTPGYFIQTWAQAMVKK